MCNSKPVSTFVVSAAIVAFGLALPVRADEGAIIGRIARGADDAAVRVCFNRGVEVKSGEELAVVRHSLRPTSPKATPVLQAAQVGLLRIAAPSKGQCANAVLVSGSAKWLDWVSTEIGS